MAWHGKAQHGIALFSHGHFFRSKAAFCRGQLPSIPTWWPNNVGLVGPECPATRGFSTKFTYGPSGLGSTRYIQPIFGPSPTNEFRTNFPGHAESANRQSCSFPQPHPFQLIFSLGAVVAIHCVTQFFCCVGFAHNTDTTNNFGSILIASEPVQPVFECDNFAKTHVNGYGKRKCQYWDCYWRLNQKHYDTYEHPPNHNANMQASNGSQQFSIPLWNNNIWSLSSHMLTFVWIHHCKSMESIRQWYDWLSYKVV